MEQGSLLTALLWSAIPALLLLAVIYYLDRYEKEPVRLLGTALLAGGVAAPLLAAGLETLFLTWAGRPGPPATLASQATSIPGFATVRVAIIEELVLGAVILLVFFLVRHEIDGLLDGLVYGGVVGVGYGLAANFWAIWTTPVILGGLEERTLFSTVVSGTNWVFYAGVIGMFLAVARRAGPGRVVVLGALGTVIAMGFHLLHDFIPTWVAADAGSIETSDVAALLADLPNVLGLIALAAIAVWTVGREKVIVGRELLDEVEAGVVTREDYATVTNSFRRFGTLAGALGGGIGTWRLRRRLYMLEVELAFRKHHDRSDRSVPAKLLEPEEYRRLIVETRSEIGPEERTQEAPA